MSQPSFSWSKPSDQLSQSTFGGGGNTSFGIPPGSGNTVGATINQNAMSTGFNSSTQQSAPLGSSMNISFNSQLQTQPGRPQTATNLSPSVVDQLQKIKDSCDPSSSSCGFQYYFYNKVPAEQSLLYTKPPGQDQSKWDEAVKNRPDSSSVPVLATGFSDLQKRVALQQQQVNTYRLRMHEINNKLNELSTRHDLYTTVKISEMKARHSKLVHRTLSLAVKIQVLKSRGYVLRPDEEVLKQKFDALNKEIDNPAVFGRINEVWARMKVLRERARALDHQISVYGNTATSKTGTSTSNIDTPNILDWERDEEQLDKLSKILKAQQTGISYLAKVLSEDTEQVDHMLKKMEEGILR